MLDAYFLEMVSQVEILAMANTSFAHTRLLSPAVVRRPLAGANAETYSSVPNNDVEDADAAEVDLYHQASADHSATIFSENKAPYLVAFPPLTDCSVVNITNTILGSGMLAMPRALATTGLAFGSFLIALSGFASAFGLTLLALCASRTGRQSSFFQISKLTYPQAAIYFDAAIAIKCFGVSVSYLVIIGDLVPTVMRALYPDASEHHIMFSKHLWISLSIAVLTPVVFAKRLDSLRHTSMLALCAVVYLVTIVWGYFVFAPANSRDGGWGLPKRPEWREIEWFKLNGNFFKILPIFVFAFTCHQNIFAVHNELNDNSLPRVSRVIHISIGTAFFVYQTIGICGYLTFGPSVAGNIISMYPASSPVITLGQAALAVLFLLSYPLQCHPARASLEKVITRGNATIEMTRTRFTVLTAGLLFASWIVAVVVDDLATVLALVGATGSTAICYILPGVLYFKMREVTDLVGDAADPDAPFRRKWDAMKLGAVALASVGCVMMVVSVGTQIMHVFSI
ncbi:hypothetical protein HDU82_008432 [Entophlyctis luteolus]|nr:hypothetical protein HDU82_008432 [Entophlyctis luteolus]